MGAENRARSGRASNAASGVSKEMKVYSLGLIDEAILPAIGTGAIGASFSDVWNPTSPDPANQEFVKSLVAKRGAQPTFFAAVAYDRARLRAAAVRAIEGKIDDALALSRALRRTAFPSVRGSLKFNANGFPLQNFYKKQVVAGPEGKQPAIDAQLPVFELHKDSLWEKCPSSEQP